MARLSRGWAPIRGRGAARCWAVLASLGVGGCLEPPGYACTSPAQCIVNAVMGECDPSTNTCVYRAPAGVCPGDYQDGAGNCVIPGPGVSVSTTSSSDASDGSASSDGDGATSTSTSTSTSSGDGSDGSTSDVASTGTSMGFEAACGDRIINLTALGLVGASTTFRGYPPADAVDGDTSTSWFSTGPEGTGIPSQYTWELGEPRCISRLFIRGNGMHANPDFREGYGFDSVTLKILDGSGAIVFEDTRSLEGTPDPDVEVDVPGVVGNEVQLEFTGHESEDCGGFSELQVHGAG